LKTEALTVAGQWRNFTAFPSILAIAVVNCAAACFRQQVSHGSCFHDINIYSCAGLAKSKGRQPLTSNIW
jgi:hypothetical protein